MDDDSPFLAHTGAGLIRFDLSAELVALDTTSPASYDVSNDETDLSQLQLDQQNAHLNNLIDQLALISPDQLPREQQLWDDLRTHLKYFDSLQDGARSKIADGIVSSLSHLVATIDRDIKGSTLRGPRSRFVNDDDDDEDAADGSFRSSSSPEELRRTYNQALEMWAFLINWLIYVADRVANSSSAGGGSSTAAGPTTTKGRGKGKKTAGAASSSSVSSGSGFPWTATILPSLLSTISKLLQSFPSALFYPLSTPRDAFLSTLLRPSLHLLERESNLKTSSNITAHVYAVTCLAVKRHGQSQTAQTMLLQMLQYYEHLPEAIAQLLTTLRLEYDSPRLAEEILVEIANRDFASSSNSGATFAMTASQENKVPRVFARFLVAFTEANPRTTLKQISLLQKLIDSDAYPIRNALVEVFGLLIRDLVVTDAQIAPQAADETVNADDTMRETSAESRKKQIESFWAILFERFLDVNSYVRVKVLSVCTRLCELPAKFPAQRIKLLALTQRGLKDKSSSARKASITLLTRLVLTHPYGLMHGGELDEKVWQARVDEVQKKMHELSGGLELPENLEDEGDQEEEDGDDDDDGDDQEDNHSIVRRPKTRKSINTAELSARLSPQVVETLNRLKLTHRYYIDGLSFIRALANSMPDLEELLYSSSKAEALEAMDFFRIAAEYKLPGAERGMRKMIHLVWTKDNAMVEPTAGGVTGAANPEDRELNAGSSGSTTRSIKGRLIEVYTSLYFTPLDHLSHKENVGLIARNLVQRTKGASLAELTSLEELLSTMSADNIIHDDVIDKLWSVYATPSRRNIERSQRRGAIVVLSMLAASRRQIVQDKIDVLLSVGLGPLGASDPVLAKWSVVALGRIGGSTKKVKGALSDRRVRFPMSHPMFSKLRSAVLSAGLAQKTGGEQAKGEWFSLAENCIQVIYELGEQPDRLCGDIVRWFLAQVFTAKEGSAAESPLQQSKSPRMNGGGFNETQTPSQSPSKGLKEATASATANHSGLAKTASAFQLAQLVFVAGHVALKQIVYLENVEREYKRRKAEAERVAKEDGGKDAKGRGGKKGAAGTTAAAKGGKKGSKDANEDEGDELEQVAGNVEDEIGEVIGEVREKELLYGGRSLLGLFGPLVVHIASNPKSYSSDHVRKAAVLTLCKFMCVSSTFCETNLSLLLHILSTSSDATTRSNVVIALGDIAVSFGNLVDENSDRLYAGLNDRDLGVKKHTLMVLTHLILNGMIKVKGQLGEMAKCLEDPEARVSDLAKLFFSELATKENAVYNNLPDIISHLSVGKHAVDEETFERTMKFIFTFVDKEKQAENVVEKLCQRFRLTSAERQWRDIAYCLSLLPYKSERSVKKLIDGLPFYQDKLHDETVYRRFVDIVAKARSARGSGGSSAKAAAAATVGGGGEAELQDFEQLIEGFHSKGEEEVQLERGTAAKVAKPQASLARGGRGGRGGARGGGTARVGGGRGGGRGRGKSAAKSEESEEEDDGDGDDSEREAVAPAPGRSRRTAAAPAAKAKKPPHRGAASRGVRRKAVVESSEEDEGEDVVDEDESF